MSWHAFVMQAAQVNIQAVSNREQSGLCSQVKAPAHVSLRCPQNQVPSPAQTHRLEGAEGCHVGVWAVGVGDLEYCMAVGDGCQGEAAHRAACPLTTSATAHLPQIPQLHQPISA